MPTLEQLRTWLSEANTALHALMSGKQVVEVWRDGRRVTYSAATAKDLRAYISQLMAEIVALDPTGAEAARPPRRAIGVRF